MAQGTTKTIKFGGNTHSIWRIYRRETNLYVNRESERS